MTHPALDRHHLTRNDQSHPVRVYVLLQDCPSETEMRLLDMLAAILQNLASHPDNRTAMYRAELAGTAALDRLLEGPSSPEPTESSAALLAGRVTIKSDATTANKLAAAGNNSRSGSSSPVQPHPTRCASPTTAVVRGSKTHSSLTKSLDAALSSGSMVRPKVIFPPISCSTAGMLAAQSGAREQWVRAGSPPLAEQQQPQQQQGQSPPTSPTARASPNLQGRGLMGCNPPHTATGVRGSTACAGLGRTACRNRSMKSRAATSIAGAPGSAMSAPDSREQFLIWMDSTFVEAAGYGDSGAAEPWAKAHHG